MQPLTGKTALITGASALRGIGRAIARRLAEDGAAVVVTDIDGDIEIEGVTTTRAQLLDRLVQDIKDSAGRAMALKLDVTDAEDSSATRRYEGTGLGLSICSDLLGMMDGHIAVVSEPNKGSKFTVTLALPIVDSQCDGRWQKMPVDLAGKRFLNVDDLPLNQTVLEHYVRSMNAVPVSASSAAEALDLIKREDFDIVIIDQMMPGADGITLARQINDLRLQNRPLLVLSSSAGEINAHSSAKRLGFDASMPKPVCLSNFEMTVSYLAGNCPRVSTPSKRRETGAIGDTAILVAEDNLSNQIVVRTYLERAGYHVDLVSDGDEAVRQFGARDYDLVLMDLRMPRVDGLEAARQIKQDFPDSRTPVIALTASVMSEDREACERIGIDDFVSKPIDPGLLLRKVAQWTDAKPEQRTARRTG